MAAPTNTGEGWVEVEKEVEEWTVVSSGSMRLATEAAWARLAAAREATGFEVAPSPLAGPVVPPRVYTTSISSQVAPPPRRRAQSPVQRSTDRLMKS